MNNRIAKIATKIAKEVESAIILPNEDAFKKYIEDHPNYRETTEFIVNGTKRKAPAKQKKNKKNQYSQKYNGKTYYDPLDLEIQLDKDFSGSDCLITKLKGGTFDGSTFYTNDVGYEKDSEPIWNWGTESVGERSFYSFDFGESGDCYILTPKGKLIDFSFDSGESFEDFYSTYYDQIEDAYNKEHEYDDYDDYDDYY
jgi:hypothetical protein